MKPLAMDAFVQRLREAFAPFPRPESIVVHDERCFDCRSVAMAFEGKDCEQLLSSAEMMFARHPIDCLNASAILHFFPSIVNQALQPQGVPVVGQLIWVLGAEEWDSDLTISMQIQPMLSGSQRELVNAVLTRFLQLPTPEHSASQLYSATRIWR